MNRIILVIVGLLSSLPVAAQPASTTHGGPGPNASYVPFIAIGPDNTSIAPGTLQLNLTQSLPVLIFHDPTSPAGTAAEFMVDSYSHIYLGDVFANFPWLTCDESTSASLCQDKGPAIRLNGDALFGDATYFGATSGAGLAAFGLGYRIRNAYASPTVIASSEVPTNVDGRGGSTITLYPDSTGCCGPGPLTADIAAVVAAGSGYVVGDTVTLAGGTSSVTILLKVLSVNGSGGITGVSVFTPGVYTGAPSNPVSQASSSGSGTSATFTMSYAAPSYLSTQGQIDYVSYNSASGGFQAHNFRGRTGSGTIGLIGAIRSDGSVLGSPTGGSKGAGTWNVAAGLYDNGARVPGTNVYHNGPSNPNGTTSLTPVNMGLAGTITPHSTGNVMFTITGSIYNDTINDGAVVQMAYGTGTAPVNGSGPTGTLCEGAQQISKEVTGDQNRYPFSLVCIASGLTVATPYWFDARLSASGGGTARIIDLNVTAHEI